MSRKRKRFQKDMLAILKTIRTEASMELVAAVMATARQIEAQEYKRKNIKLVKSA